MAESILEPLKEMVAIREREKGVEEGIQKGIQKGIQRGIQRGMLKGREEGMQETALKMKQKGATVEFIQKVTGLPTEKIAKALINLLKSQPQQP